MKINIKYFGLIADITNCEEEWANIEENENLESLLSKLSEKYSALKQANFNIALNLEINTNLNKQLKDLDEIALLPPFAGG
ncbi:MAG: MoaD/ThiS family protein [Chitinophagales bacterium]|nr:MoaD/ThiS family protein [Bacteroidota bacterium]